MLLKIMSSILFTGGEKSRDYAGQAGTVYRIISYTA
jgi:hypothetical protein